jgi:hypothetical protein
MGSGSGRCHGNLAEWRHTMSIDNTIFFSSIAISVIIFALVKMADWQAKHRADKNEKHDSNHSGA